MPNLKFIFTLKYLGDIYTLKISFALALIFVTTYFASDSKFMQTYNQANDTLFDIVIGILTLITLIVTWLYYDSLKINKIIKRKNDALHETKDDLLETNLELQKAREELLKANNELEILTRDLESKNNELIISKQVLQETNQELQNVQKTFKNLVYGTSEPILLIHEGKFVSCNNAALELLQYRRKWEVLNHPPSEFSPKYQPDGKLSSVKSDEMMQNCMQNGSHKFQWVYTKNNGEDFWCDVNLTKIVMDYRDMIHVTWRDISVEKKLQAELEKLAVTDKLTKVYNRHKIDDALEASKELMDRYNTPFGIIILDIDHFKKINDTYGHHSGDIVLQQFASILSENSRKSDVVGRIGGEEFLIIMPHATELSIMSFAKKLHDEIREFDFDTVGRVTASMGVSMYENSESVDALVSRADKALYESKNNARDCITFK